MADNVTLNSGSGGLTAAGASLSFSGDTAVVQIVSPSILTGSEGAWTMYHFVGGAGAVSGGVQRVTLASDDPAVTALQLVDNVIYVDDADWTALTSSHALVGGIYQSTPGTITDGDTGPIRLTANGAVHVSDAGGSLTVDNGGTFAVQVDAALPAGTNAIGKLAANSGVDIGDVDVTSVVPGTGATNLGKAIDTAAGSTDTGVAALAIRDDSLTTLTPIDGDYVPLRVNSTGALHVTGGGGGTQYNIDDAAGGTDTGTVLLAIRDDSLSTLTPVDGDYVGLRVNSTGALHVTGGGGGTEYAVDDALGSTPTGGVILAKRDDALSSLTPIEGDAVELRVDANGALWSTISGTVAATQSGTWNVTNISGTVSLPTGAATAANQSTIIGHVDGIEALLTTIDADTGTLAVVGGGTEATALRVTLASDSTGVVSIDDNSGSLTVDNAGTFAVQVDGSALTALQLIDDVVYSDDAAFTPGTSKVAAIGATADEASTDSVDEGDVGAVRMTLDRKLIVAPQPHSAGGLSIFRSLDIDETEEDVKTSAGCVYGMWVTNTATSTRFVKFYNATAASVTVGTTTPVITIGIPGNSSDDVSGNFGPGGTGIYFDTAICVAATTGVADADTGAPSANDVIVNIFYK